MTLQQRISSPNPQEALVEATTARFRVKSTFDTAFARHFCASQSRALECFMTNSLLTASGVKIDFIQQGYTLVPFLAIDKNEIVIGASQLTVDEDTKTLADANYAMSYLLEKILFLVKLPIEALSIVHTLGISTTNTSKNLLIAFASSGQREVFDFFNILLEGILKKQAITLLQDKAFELQLSENERHSIALKHIYSQPFDFSKQCIVQAYFDQKRYLNACDKTRSELSYILRLLGTNSSSNYLSEKIRFVLFNGIGEGYSASLRNISVAHAEYSKPIFEELNEVLNSVSGQHPHIVNSFALTNDAAITLADNLRSSVSVSYAILKANEASLGFLLPLTHRPWSFSEESNASLGTLFDEHCFLNSAVHSVPFPRSEIQQLMEKRKSSWEYINLPEQITRWIADNVVKANAGGNLRLRLSLQRSMGAARASMLLQLLRFNDSHEETLVNEALAIDSYFENISHLLLDTEWDLTHLRQIIPDDSYSNIILQAPAGIPPQIPTDNQRLIRKQNYLRAYSFDFNGNCIGESLVAIFDR